MGLQAVLMLLVMVLFCFCSSASFASVSKNLVPENTHENMGNKRSGMVNQSKYTSAIARGGGGGRSTGVGSTENGNGDQSNSSPQGGGNGVVPVYAAGAGAAAQRKNHKGGAATYTLCWKGRFALLLATSTSLLLHIPV